MSLCFQCFEKWANLRLPSNVQKPKMLQLQGGSPPPDQGLCPWTPPSPRYRLAPWGRAPRFCGLELPPLNRPTFPREWSKIRSGPALKPPLYRTNNWIQARETRVFNRPEFSGRHDFQAKKFGRQCTKPGSHAVGLQENSSKNLMQNNTSL